MGNGSLRSPMAPPIPSSLKPIWRVIQVYEVSRGLTLGLSAYIIGPYFYDTFRRYGNDKEALMYVAVLLSIFFGLVALFEIPTGALGDTIGRVRVVIASTFMKVIDGLLLAAVIFFDSFIIVFILMVLTRIATALSYTLASGNFSAWVVDSIREKEPNYGYERLLARGHEYQQWATIVGSLLGIATYLHGVPYIAFISRSLIALGCVTYCIAEMEESFSLSFLSPHRRVWSAMVERMRKTMRTAFAVCNSNPQLWWLVIGVATYKYLLDVVDYLWPVAMRAQFGVTKWSPQWYMMAVFMPLSVALMARMLSRLGDRAQRLSGQRLSNRSLRYFLTGSFLLAALPVIVLGFLNSQGLFSFPMFAATILAVECTFGIVEPSFSTLVNNYLPEKNASERATILSFGSFVRSILVLLLMIPSSGPSANRSPLGWLLPAIILLLVALLTNWRLKKNEQFCGRAENTFSLKKEAAL